MYRSAYSNHSFTSQYNRKLRYHKPKWQNAHIIASIIIIETTRAIRLTFPVLFSSFLRIIFIVWINRTPMGFQARRSEGNGVICQY